MIARKRYLQELVLDPHVQLPDDIEKHDSFVARIRRALSDAELFPSRVGQGDLAALVRQGVLRCHLAHREQPELRVPSRHPWPDERVWKAHRCHPRRVDPAHFDVQVDPWVPAWLDVGALKAIEDAVRESPRRMVVEIPADPAVTELTGFRMYTGDGQREAVRAAFFMPPGDTVVVQLPTGGGKTLAFQLPALAFERTGGFVFVVTPTVALARDQEERFLSLVKSAGRDGRSGDVPLAYHSGLSAEGKRALVSAIGGGEGLSLPIAFASPEAAVGALQPALLRAARAGRLRLFVVDEAHIVDQWGHLFRPEFQSLAGLRKALLEACPRPEGRFGTLLLTATLTREAFAALSQLFGASREQIVAEPALRPEPGFLVLEARDEEERRSRVLEAVRFLPRPLIVYTTLREDAEDWQSCLSSELCGAPLRRLRLVRGGDLSGAVGESTLEEWRSGQVDVVVATSAFGLGVDQANVRSIIHACLPETIDRFYQEVGRSGRDGNASVSLLVSTPSDVKIAGNLHRRLITVDRGLERWMAMLRTRQVEGDSVVRVSLDALPGDLFESTQEGSKWNLRTLVLMARAGLVEFVAMPPPVVRRGDTETDAEYEDRQQRATKEAHRTATIRILDGRHASEEHWHRVVEPKRRELHAASKYSFGLVRDLARRKRRLNDLFREVYTIPELGVEPPRLAGSCPVTRSEGCVDFDQPRPSVRTISRTRLDVAPRFEAALRPVLDPWRRAWVAYDASLPDPRAQEASRRGILDLLRYGVSDGFAEIGASTSIIDERTWVNLLAGSPYRFITRASVEPLGETDGVGVIQLPRITVLDSRDARAETISAVARLERQFHVIVLPSNTPDIERPERRFFDTRTHRTLKDVLERLDRWES